MYACTGSLAAPALAGSDGFQPDIYSKVSFPNVSNGSTVGSPVKVEFAVDGMDILPAAQGIIEGAALILVTFFALDL